MPASLRVRAALGVVTLAVVAAPVSALAATKPKPPTITHFAPAAVVAMKTVVVTGTNFAHVKAVTIDGMRATFKVDSAKKLTVTVPAKAKSGAIWIRTAAGTAKSRHPLKIKA